MSDPVVICSFARTPMGGFQGALSGVKATDLGAAAVKAAVERAGVPAAKVDQIYMGCVLPAGLGQAPARQAAIGAGLGHHGEPTPDRAPWKPPIGVRANEQMTTGSDMEGSKGSVRR